MPSKSRYQGRGFNPVSPLPFAQAKEQRVQGKQARQDMLKQREKQDKERDKELAEQQKRLEGIALGWGMSKGEASSSSRGQLSGFIEGKVVEVATRKRETDELIQEHKVLKGLVEEKKTRDLETRLRKEIADDPTKATTFLHDLVRQNVTPTRSIIEQVALLEMEHDRKMELRKGLGAGQGWKMTPAAQDPNFIGPQKPWQPGQPGVFSTTSASGMPQNQFVYGSGQGAGAAQPQPATAFGKNYFTIGTGASAKVYHRDPQTGEVTQIGSNQVIPAALLPPDVIDEINDKINELTDDISVLQKKPNPNPADRKRMGAMMDERKFHQSRLTGSRQMRSGQQQQQPGSAQAPTARPPNNMPGKQDVTPQAPYYMEQSSGGWNVALDMGLLLDPQDPKKGTVYNNADRNTKIRWLKEMFARGMFGDPNSRMAKSESMRWAAAVLRIGTPTVNFRPQGAGRQNTAPAP